MPIIRGGITLGRRKSGNVSKEAREQRERLLQKNPQYWLEDW